MKLWPELSLVVIHVIQLLMLAGVAILHLLLLLLSVGCRHVVVVLAVTAAVDGLDLLEEFLFSQFSLRQFAGQLFYFLYGGKVGEKKQC